MLGFGGVRPSPFRSAARNRGNFRQPFAGGVVLMAVGDEVERVHQAQGGDHGAFAELVACYERMAYNLALRMVGDREDARDLTQAVFLNAYRSLGSIDT